MSVSTPSFLPESFGTSNTCSSFGWCTFEVFLWIFGFSIVIVAEGVSNLVAHIQHSIKYNPRVISFENRQLPDSGILLSKYMSWNSILPSIAIELVVPIGLCVATLLLFVYRKEYNRLRRLLAIVYTMYLMRAISVCLTVLPDPYEKCFQLSEEVLQLPFLESLWILLSKYLMNIPNMCGTCFFSGHSSLCIMIAIEWIAILDSWLYSSPVWGLVLLEIYCMFVEGFHYTLDIVAGILIGLALEQVFPFHWSLSHIKTLANMGMFRVQNKMHEQIKKFAELSLPNIQEINVPSVSELKLVLTEMINNAMDNIYYGNLNSILSGKSSKESRVSSAATKTRSRSKSRTAAKKL